MCNLHKENTDIGVTFSVSNTASKIRLICLIQRAPRRPLSRRVIGFGNLIARTGKARDRGDVGLTVGWEFIPRQTVARCGSVKGDDITLFGFKGNNRERLRSPWSPVFAISTQLYSNIWIAFNPDESPSILLLKELTHAILSSLVCVSDQGSRYNADKSRFQMLGRL